MAIEWLRFVCNGGWAAGISGYWWVNNRIIYFILLIALLFCRTEQQMHVLKWQLVFSAHDVLSLYCIAVNTTGDLAITMETKNFKKKESFQLCICFENWISNELNYLVASFSAILQLQDIEHSFKTACLCVLQVSRHLTLSEFLCPRQLYNSWPQVFLLLIPFSSSGVVGLLSPLLFLLRQSSFHPVRFSSPDKSVSGSDVPDGVCVRVCACVRACTRVCPGVRCYLWVL